MVDVKTLTGLVRSHTRLTQIRFVFTLFLVFQFLLELCLFVTESFISNFREVRAENNRLEMFDLFQMPVCQFFLRGKCSNDNCPYSHVNVSKKAKVCEDFLKGFCARGQQVSTQPFSK